MRLTISGFVLLTIFCSTPAYAQVKRWIDKKGIVHLEGTGPERPKGTDSSQPNPNALRPIERNFTDLRLGDEESLFTASKKAVHIANNGYNGNFYNYSSGLPEGAVKMG